jgi:hypothetical protein
VGLPSLPRPGEGRLGGARRGEGGASLLQQLFPELRQFIQSRMLFGRAREILCPNHSLSSRSLTELLSAAVRHTGNCGLRSVMPCEGSKVS